MVLELQCRWGRTCLYGWTFYTLDCDIYRYSFVMVLTTFLYFTTLTYSSCTTHPCLRTPLNEQFVHTHRCSSSPIASSMTSSFKPYPPFTSTDTCHTPALRFVRKTKPLLEDTELRLRGADTHAQLRASTCGKVNWWYNKPLSWPLYMASNCAEICQVHANSRLFTGLVWTLPCQEWTRSWSFALRTNGV